MPCLLCRAGRELDNAPYQIGNGYGSLNTRTMAMSAKHRNGVLEWDAHNIYGLAEGIATAHSVANITGSRPFVLTRSSFAGSGHTVAHWTGDNDATWQSLQLSVGSVLTFNLLGMPLVGADICGFRGDTTMELCARWISAGTCRSHLHRTLLHYDSHSPVGCQCLYNG